MNGFENKKNSIDVCNFKSHENTKLIDHLLAVATKTQELTKDILPENQDVAFLAGFFHDIGKLNPFYQQEFGTIKQVSNKLLRLHSIFSAILADKYIDWQKLSSENNNYLLKNVENNTQKTIANGKIKKREIISAIFGHHSSLHFGSAKYNETKINSDTWNYINQKLNEWAPEFISCAIKRQPNLGAYISENLEQKLNYPLQDIVSKIFPQLIRSEEQFEDYKLFLDFSIIYSALLQADRGTFALADTDKPYKIGTNLEGIYTDWKPSKFTINFDTTKLIKSHASKLYKIRTSIQDSIWEQLEAILKNSDKINMLTIKAPTGSGKTKVFLDLVDKIKTQNTERIFYFSPLLALSDDFINKLKNEHIVNEKDKTKILIYNHLYKQMLSDRDLEEESQKQESQKQIFNFEQEIFNKEMVITTTERLLLTLFSNYYKDKIKFLSIKNSILIIDEIQELPFEILQPTLWVLREISNRMGAKIIFVSATIPDPLKEETKVIEPDKNYIDIYLKMNKKEIIIEEGRTPDANSINRKEKTLIMFNTRREARNFAEQINPDYYLSRGIRYKDRKEIIKRISNAKEGITVSTQVLEAGVDLSFDVIYRELAPLDSIIQVMGRLNRELMYDSPKLIIFNAKEKSVRPYSDLEISITKKILDSFGKRNILSNDLIIGIDKYYNEYFYRNAEIRSKNESLDYYIKSLSFDAINERINKVLSSEKEISVLIPDENNLVQVLTDLKNNKKIDSNQIAEMTADMSFGVIESYRDLFDEELYERGIYVPKDKNSLQLLYDRKYGLDKLI
jgi:CRISPR-associated helicase Cas3/CRISPR-associated endonuclease Cas3-HD